MTGVEDRTKVRVSIIALLIMSMFGVLVARLWFLQVLAGEEFAQRALSNHVRLVSVEAPRGRILDRNGRVIVKNRPAQAVGVRKDDLPRDRKQARAVLKRLAILLDMKMRELDLRLADRRGSPYKPIVVAEDVPEEIIFTIRERQDRFPGVETLTLPVRTYPHGRVASHILGYVGETTETEVDKLEAYRLGDKIGRTGIESTYERWLRGVPGLQKLVVDASGRVLDNLTDELSPDAVPKPGSDLYLTIDLEAQRVAERALAEGILRARAQSFRRTGERFRAPAGAAIVLDAQNGDVIAMASHPTFDLRRFVGGVSEDYWSFLNDERNDYPLLNRTIQAAYPPGSTFKPLLATAALATGAGTPGGRYPCQTTFRFGDTVFRNWQPRSGTISLSQSLVESCDTVYYNFARNWWLSEENQIDAGRKPTETMQVWSRNFGLDAPTGIDLPQETDGRIPDRAWRQEVWDRNKGSYCATYKRTGSVLFEDLCERGYLWRGGDAVNMSIGQGDVLTTPLQLAVAYATIANGGKVMQPHLGLRIQSPGGKLQREIKPKVIKRVKAPASAFSYVHNALLETSRRGTAAYPYRGWPLARIPMAGKTGSAEIAGKQPYSWFASYGPGGNPRYVAVAVVEEAGFGSQVSGPIVRRIMDELFDLTPLPIVYGTAASD